jgi:hypothetical protein
VSLPLPLIDFPSANLSLKLAFNFNKCLPTQSNFYTVHTSPYTFLKDNGNNFFIPDISNRERFGALRLFECSFIQIWLNLCYFNNNSSMCRLHEA